MNLYDATVPVFTKLLSNVEKWIDKAAAHASAKKFEVDGLASARLAPDQYPFARQIQSACDQAKFTAAKLTGKEPPAHPDTEKTMAELRQRMPRGISDEELLLRFGMPDEEVDAMLAAAPAPRHYTPEVQPVLRLLRELGTRPGVSRLVVDKPGFRLSLSRSAGG